MVAMISSPAKALEWLWNRSGSPPSRNSISRLWASVVSQKWRRDCRGKGGTRSRETGNSEPTEMEFKYEITDEVTPCRRDRDEGRENAMSGVDIPRRTPDEA